MPDLHPRRHSVLRIPTEPVFSFLAREDQVCCVYSRIHQIRGEPGYTTAGAGGTAAGAGAGAAAGAGALAGAVGKHSACNRCFVGTALAASAPAAAAVGFSAAAAAAVVVCNHSVVAGIAAAVLVEQAAVWAGAASTRLGCCLHQTALRNCCYLTVCLNNLRFQAASLN